MFFNKRGELEYTIRFFESKDLPLHIIIKISKAFPGFELLLINELDLNNSYFYFIRIKQNDSQKTFIVSEDDIQLYSNLQPNN
jgi:hypothetical protein